MDKESPNTEPTPNSFAEQADTKPPSFLRELWDFIAHNKKWWLVPIIVALLLISILVLLTANNALAPFIYAIF
jgi:hypothetical protein